MLESLLIGGSCLVSLFTMSKMIEDLICSKTNIKTQRIKHIDEIAKTERILRSHIDSDDKLYYFINVKTKEIWAELNNYHKDCVDDDVILIDPSDYIMNGEIPTEEQIEFIRDMIIKKYTLYPETAIEHKSKYDKCNCGEFYR